MVYFFLPDKRCFGISARKLTVIFVCLDIIAFLTQGASSSLLNSDTPNTVKVGINICKILPLNSANVVSSLTCV